MSEEVESHVLKRYELVQKLGKGAYGIVWKCIDKKSKQVLALKKIFDAFQNPADAQKTFREIMILQEVDHENIVKLHNVMKAENDKDIYLVFEYLDTDLHAVIRANILEEVHKQYILYQILKCLKYMHTGDLLHRDLKPSNILIGGDCTAKVADFGLARSIATNPGEPAPILTDDVATRWYRPPEVILGSQKYSKALDIWSVGCIFGEMLLGKQVFPGDSNTNQLERIIELTGRPTQEDIAAMGSSLAAKTLEAINPKKFKTFSEVFPNASPEAIDLLKGLLHFNPNKRLTAAQALEHPYLYDFHNPDDEPSAPKPIRLPLDENKKYSIREYRDKLYEEILRKKKAVRKQILSSLQDTEDIKTNRSPSSINSTNSVGDLDKPISQGSLSKGPATSLNEMYTGSALSSMRIISNQAGSLKYTTGK